MAAPDIGMVAQVKLRREGFCPQESEILLGGEEVFEIGEAAEIPREGDTTDGIEAGGVLAQQTLEAEQASPGLIRVVGLVDDPGSPGADMLAGFTEDSELVVGVAGCVPAVGMIQVLGEDDLASLWLQPGVGGHGRRGGSGQPRLRGGRG